MLRKNNKNKNHQHKNGSINTQKIKRQKLHKAYYSAANVLWQLNEKSGSLNSLMNQFNGDKCIKMIYALAVKVLKSQNTIEKIKSKLPEYDKNVLNSYLIEILIAELLFGEKSFLKYRRKDEVKYVIDNQKIITDIYRSVQNEEHVENKNHLIRYVRINFLKTSKSELRSKLKELGFVEKVWQKNKISFDEFKDNAKSLNAKEFMNDFHFDDMILFNDEASKTLTNLYQSGLIAMQDKSSLLAIQAMELKEGMVIFDACAAPGMKTAAIASRLNNNCTLYANDRNKKRFNEMKTLLSRSGVKFKSITQDFSQIDPAKYENLDILLVDPSCSGSGINRRLEYKSNNDNQLNDDMMDTGRCEKLAKFQLALLQCAIGFNAKRIIYCTCSKYQIENEDVINSLLESNPDMNYIVIDPMPQWPYRGCGDYPFSKLCLRADYENTLTNGFFCCVLQRSDSSSLNSNVGNETNEQITELQTTNENHQPECQINKNKRSVDDENGNNDDDDGNPKSILPNEESGNKKKRKRRKKIHQIENSFSVTPFTM